MLSEKMEYLLHEMDTNSKTVAGYAGMTPSGLSRMRSGSRTYRRGSPTVRRFIEGMCAYAAAENRLDRLRLIVGVSSDEEWALKEALETWLFDDVNVREGGLGVAPELFAGKLRRLMELADVTNSRLGKDLNIDASYVSRMRNGRVPKRGSRIMQKLCGKLAERIFDHGEQDSLAELLGLPADFVQEEDAQDLIFAWLYQEDETESFRAIKTLLHTIETISDDPVLEAPPADDIFDESVVNERDDRYIGTFGIQRAAIRFLGNAVKNGTRQIMVYTDQSMDWLKGPFNKVWRDMVWECVRHNIRFIVIHNVERNASELLTTLDRWMPMYNTGLIEPYYSTQKLGERFTHTMFMDDQGSCLEGCSVKGLENRCEYTYICDKERLDPRYKAFDRLLELSRPLTRVGYDLAAELEETGEKFVSCDYGGLQILVGGSSVVITKTAAPKRSFLFTHPMTHRAFAEFVGRQRKT